MGGKGEMRGAKAFQPKAQEDGEGFNVVTITRNEEKSDLSFNLGGRGENGRSKHNLNHGKWGQGQTETGEGKSKDDQPKKHEVVGEKKMNGAFKSYDSGGKAVATFWGGEEVDTQQGKLGVSPQNSKVW